MTTSVQNITKSRTISPAQMMLGFWVFLGILDLIKNWANTVYAGRDFSLLVVLPFISCYILSWFIISYPIYQLFKRTLQLSWAKRVLVQLPASLLFSAMHTLILCWLFSSYVYVGQNIPQDYLAFMIDRLTTRFVPPWIDSTASYWMVLVILFALSYYEKSRQQSLLAAELETQLGQAELQALRMQVQPHFLFNANNTIAMLIRTGQYDQAVEMISGLSDLLRTTLTREHEQYISLKEELELTSKYLAIEQIRFRDRLTCSIESSATTDNALVPSLILQPLVENAFKHGISFCMKEARLEINCSRKNGTLMLTVFNSGPPLPESGIEISYDSIGLTNVRERLQKLYSDRYEMRINNHGNGVKVELEIPFQQQELNN
ncbi:MAG: sensor histidine kinase [Calditrichia bacterium]